MPISENCNLSCSDDILKVPAWLGRHTFATLPCLSFSCTSSAFFICLHFWALDQLLPLRNIYSTSHYSAGAAAGFKPMISITRAQHLTNWATTVLYTEVVAAEIHRLWLRTSVIHRVFLLSIINFPLLCWCGESFDCRNSLFLSPYLLIPEYCRFSVVVDVKM